MIFAAFCIHLQFFRYKFPFSVINTGILQKGKERSFDLCIAGTVCRSAPNDYNIRTAIEFTFMQSVAFMNKSLDPVPDNAVPDLLTDRNSDSVMICAVFSYINDEIFVGIGFPGPIACPEIFILPD